MAGTATIEQRRELLTAHRRKVVAKQHQIEVSLQEIDYKLATYSAPDAVAQISRKIEAALEDHQLPVKR